MRGWVGVRGRMREKAWKAMFWFFTSCPLQSAHLACTCKHVMSIWWTNCTCGQFVVFDFWAAEHAILCTHASAELQSAHFYCTCKHLISVWCIQFVSLDISLLNMWLVDIFFRHLHQRSCCRLIWAALATLLSWAFFLGLGMWLLMWIVFMYTSAK